MNLVVSSSFFETCIQTSYFFYDVKYAYCKISNMHMAYEYDVPLDQIELNNNIHSLVLSIIEYIQEWYRDKVSLYNSIQ